MKKATFIKTVRVVAVLFISSFIAVFLLYSRPHEERTVKNHRQYLVETTRAFSEAVEMTVEGYGTVIPRETVELLGEVTGRVKNIHPGFVQGGYVKSGSCLLTIDPESYVLDVNAAEARLKKARADLDMLLQDLDNITASLILAEKYGSIARDELLRAQELNRRLVTARSALDRIRQREIESRRSVQELKNKKASVRPLMMQRKALVELSENALAQSKLALEKTQVFAPFNGWILKKTVDVGEFARPGTCFGSMFRAGKLDIEIRLPLGDFQWIEPLIEDGLNPAAIIRHDSKGLVKRWNGKVTRVFADVDSRTRTLSVIVEVDPENIQNIRSSFSRLRPGMFVSVEIRGVKKKGIFKLSRHLVHNLLVNTVVEGRAKQKRVNIIRSFKNHVYIDFGLMEGETIVTSPMPSSFAGMEVRTDR